jgi:hypothetical protein
MDKRPLIVVSICAMVLLVLGSLSNVVGYQTVQSSNQNTVISKSYVNDIVINGTMGQNGWYISPVSITFEDELLYYVNIDEGDWFVYTEPIIVDTDGIHTLLWYSIDPMGGHSPIYNVTVKIDQTPPMITIIKMITGPHKYTIYVTVSDNTSGVSQVLLHLDDVDVLLPEPPYEFWWTIGFGEHTIKVIAYDIAGLNASSSMNTPYSLSYIQRNLLHQQIISVFQNLLLRHQFIVRQIWN